MQWSECDNRLDDDTMRSSSHQGLVLWIARKMAADGFVLSGYDGSVPQGGLWNCLPRPAEFGGVRPDAWGIMPATGELAVGEAKTPADIDTVHTRRQLWVFGRLRARKKSIPCRLYIAVPRSAAPVLDRVLAQVGLLCAKHVVRLHIPDCLVAEERDECA
jgi:hypothetical protein